MEKVTVVRTKLGDAKWIGSAVAVAVAVGLTASGCSGSPQTAVDPKAKPSSSAAVIAAVDAGPQPEDVLPANAIAFAKLDLNPSVGQKLALFRLASKFPELKNTMKSEQTPIKESIFGSIFTGRTANSALGLDYKKDVEPWLGDRIGLGVFPDANGDKQPEVGVAVAVTDQKAAKIALDKAVGTIAKSPKAGAKSKSESMTGYAFADGYVILSDTTANATKLAQAGKASSLAKSKYAEDVKKLAPDQLAVFWTDVAALYKAIPVDQLAMTLGPLKEALKGANDPSNASGRAVVGLRADPSFLEVTGKVIGFKGAVSPLKAATGTALIATFPAEVMGAVSMTGLGKQVGALYTSFTAKGDTLGIKPALNQVGLRSAKDIETLLGAETGVMVGDRRIPGVGQLELAVRTRGSDADAALVIARRLGAMLPGGQVDMAKVTGPDGIVVGWKSALTSAISNLTGAKLGSTEAFKQVAPDAATADLAGYVDLAKLIAVMGSTSPEVSASLKPLKALGVTTTGGTEPTIRLRLSFN